MKSLSRVQLFATPWTVAHQAPPSMGFSRWEEWVAIKAKQLVLFASNYTAEAKRSLPYVSTVTQTLSLALGHMGRRCIWPACHGWEDGATGITELGTKPCQWWHLSCTCSFIPLHWMEKRDFREMSQSLDPEVERISAISRPESISLPGPSELIGKVRVRGI